MTTMNSSKPSDKALALLLKYEVGGGRNYYEKYLSKFTWPGGASGPTIGIGIDCAYYSDDELDSIFNFLKVNNLNLTLIKQVGFLIDKLHYFYSKFFQGHIKLGNCSTVQIRRSNNVISTLSKAGKN